MLDAVFSNRKLSSLNLNISFAELDEIDSVMKNIGYGLSNLMSLQYLKLDLSYTRLQGLSSLSKGFKLNNNLKCLELNIRYRVYISNCYSNTNVSTLDDLVENLSM